MNPKPSYVTREGMEKLRQELDTMIDVRRPEVAARIQEAKEHGDLSENAEYEDAKNEQAFVEGRIQSLEALIKNAVIIDEHHATDHVSIGSTVALKSSDGKEAYTIVGPTEASPREGRISNESPLGKVLLGRKVGESVTVTRPGRRHRVQDHRHQLGARHVLGRRAGGRRHRAPGRQRLQDAVGHRPRRQPARASCCTTPSPGRSATPASRPRFLYGVDDLDPMDAQALLTPDAVDRYMGVPLAHVPAPGGQHARRATRATSWASCSWAPSPASASIPRSTG